MLLHHFPNDGLFACLLGTLQCPNSSLNRMSWLHHSSKPVFDSMIRLSYSWLFHFLSRYRCCGYITACRAALSLSFRKSIGSMDGRFAIFLLIAFWSIILNRLFSILWGILNPFLQFLQFSHNQNRNYDQKERLLLSFQWFDCAVNFVIWLKKKVSVVSTIVNNNSQVQ